MPVGRHGFHRVQGILGNNSIRCPAFRNNAEAVTIARTVELPKAMNPSLASANDRQMEEAAVQLLADLETQKAVTVGPASPARFDASWRQDQSRLGVLYRMCRAKAACAPEASSSGALAAILPGSPAFERACGPDEWPRIFRGSFSPRASHRRVAVSSLERRLRVASSSSAHEVPGRCCCRGQVPAIEKLLAGLRNAAILHAADRAGVSLRMGE
jgi:hypothetical protein